MEARPERPRFPKDYGVSESGDLLDWSYVDERMTGALHYWLATVSPAGAPHTRPVAGMWLDRALYMGGSAESQWCRNLMRDPRACINLSEPGDSALILHGAVRIERPDTALAKRLADASNAKYDYGQQAEEYEGEVILVFEPKRVYAWKTLKDATRWRL